MKLESVVEMATRYIEELIITGKLKPGEQIKEENIANEINISRPPIREALNCLEGEGLVVRKPRKGAFVIEMTEADIWEVYTLKAELYAMAMDCVITTITDEQTSLLQSLVDQMKEITDTGQPAILQYQKLHRMFHLQIMEIAGNNRLLKFASSLHKQIRKYSFKTLSNEEHLRTSKQYHQQIVDMIIKKDRENAHKLMKEHVLSAMHFLLDTPGILTDLDLNPHKNQ